MKPTFIYGTAWKKNSTAELVTLALKEGFRAIDTANQPKHYNEPQVGEALKASALKRSELFLQTKFTPIDGHDERVPYDSSKKIKDQVLESFEGSLSHLNTDYLDSYLLHGPYGRPGLSGEDHEVWETLEALYKDGKVKNIGISNVNHLQLETLCKAANTKPMFVQNRCFARTGWDKSVREICKREGITYQGFSLLTANPEILMHAKVREMAARLGGTPAQVVFAFAREVGMVPLTGTSQSTHMKEDLASSSLQLTSEDRANLSVA